MKTKLFLLCLSGFFYNSISKAQDLMSIKSSSYNTQPGFIFTPSSSTLSVQLVIKNGGYYEATAFDVSAVIKNTATGTEYEIDRVDYQGLSNSPSTNQNILEITGWTINLKNKPQVPNGTYRLQARINDNKKAKESSYVNNTEVFGNESFNYGTSTTVVTTGNQPNINLGLNININDGENSGTATTTSYSTTTTTSTSGSADTKYVLPGYNGVYGCPYPMSASDFESAKQSVKSKAFDDSKLTIAKQIIGSNCMLCSQIKELMLLITFEGTRLDLAKFAWDHNLDKGNYFKLNDAFTFESSIDELTEYTQSNKE